MSVRVRYPGPAVTDEHYRKEGVTHSQLGLLTPGAFEISDELAALYAAPGGSGLLERIDVPVAAPAPAKPKAAAAPKDEKEG